jgi:uncharacterized membrane protein YraQ (UPF0718 family)
MAKRSGLQYRADKAAQRIGPLRAADAWGLKHPAVNVASFVVLAVAFGCAAAFAWHSVVLGIVVGVVVAIVLPLATRRNHRRRVDNGTSAQYGPPR